MIGFDNNAKQQLKSLVNKIDRLLEEKSHVEEALRETYAEAKAHGFDVKILKQVLKLRSVDPKELEEQDALIDLYRDILEV